MNFNNVLNALNLGIVILDSEYNVRLWNDWMATHSHRNAEEMIGRSIFDIYPNLNKPVFLRSFKSVFTFGNFYFFSQKLHGYLFPIPITSSFQTSFELMQQSCTICPMREGDGPQVTHLCITVQDVTEMAELVETNQRDFLTGTYNRRFLFNRLKEEFERHRRYKRPMSLLIIDIDHFKLVNDTYGHQCGDFVLKSVCDTIQSALRRVDILARYGGEEFCCILPETPFENSHLVAERIRSQVEATLFEYNGNFIKVTVSIGIPKPAEPTDSLETLLKNADSALYEAKAFGRNRVAFSR
ncbi:MAG: diguanylate cyclase [Syntrophorhabdaceae bacterium]|nr:diguanylate cyclase [Syntrophorhabdaceae bacterium]